MANCEEESRSFVYDVFLNFRGEDTRDTFIKDLREEMRIKGIQIFNDDDNDDMRDEEDISPAISKAIEESKISVVVFSENYATSTRCLEELVKILDCKEINDKRHIVPIFYHVDPSDIRNQKNSYGKAITEHKNKFPDKKVQTWKSALTKIGGSKGFHFPPGSQINFIDIVKVVDANSLPKPLPVNQDPVGLHYHLEKVKSLLDKKSNDKTVMLGIYGLGGVGKTELATTLYNQIVHQFDAASFLEIGRGSDKEINGLEDMQKKLLSDMREEPQTELGNTSKGIDEIKSKLSKKKVLLVLDDMYDKEQLNNLAGGCDWFGSDSKIIITTRDKSLLGHPVGEVYEMTELNDQHSLELFCQNAFGKSHPEADYENVSVRVAGYAKGLPLALKVIGSELGREKNLKAWECALKEYKRIPNQEIQERLEISYDRLEHDAKCVFLDIACFFNGERVEYVEKILGEFNAKHYIQVLVDKSLLTIEEGCVKMHDLIQDMGREIVRQEKPLNPSNHNREIVRQKEPLKLGNRSRLWFYEDVRKVLTEDSGSDKIEGIMLDSPQQEEIYWSGTAFKKMKNLRILIVRNTSFSPEPGYLPNHLRLLEWENYPSQSLPPTFHPRKIIVFNLSKSYLTPKEPFKVEHISELPSTIQKVYATYCFLSEETSTLLWSQVRKETSELEIVMPHTEIPKWFDFQGHGENLHFWVGKKFPSFALALVFHDVKGVAKKSQELVELELVINDQRVPRKGYYNFRIPPGHVLVCDLRLLFSDEQWRHLDSILKPDWNEVKVSCDSTMMLSCWGVFVYKQETNMEDIKFMYPEHSYTASTSHTKIVPPKDPNPKQRREMIDSLALDEMFEGTMLEFQDFKGQSNFADQNFDEDQMHNLLGNLKKMSEDAKGVLEGKNLDDNSLLAWVLDTIQKDEDDEKDEPSNNVGESSTSSHQGSLEVQVSDFQQQQQEMMMKIFEDGMLDGLLEAQRNFPALDIQTTMNTALNMGIRAQCTFTPIQESQVENSEVEDEDEGPPVEMKIYVDGMINGLYEAKLSFPTLDIQGTLSTVLRRRTHEEPMEAPPPTRENEEHVTDGADNEENATHDEVATDEKS